MRVFDVPFDSFHNEMVVSCFYVLSLESTAGADPRDKPDMRLNSIRQSSEMDRQWCSQCP